jgi:SAM domain (Sterile alpha motif)
MDVARWLRGLGLQRYEQAFRENDFDAEILPELTGEDLVGLGVNSVGHRRKLLAAIAVLRAEVSPTAGSAQRSEPRPMLFSTSGSDDPSVDCGGSGFLDSGIS